VWPVKLNAAMHLFVKEFGEELLEDLCWLEAHGSTLAEIARHFYNPARPYRLIEFVLYSMRRNRYSVSEQRELVLKLLAMTKSLKHGSEFDDDGCNIIYNRDTVESVAASRFNEPIRSLAESELVHQLCGLLWAYTESILFRAREVAMEFHGPYSFEHGRKRFLVKEYFNLRPLELWGDAPLMSCQRVTVYLQYNARLRSRIEWHNRLCHEGAPLKSSLESYAIEIDGRRQDVTLLAHELAAAAATIGAISRYVDSVTWNERVMKYAEVFWFRKRPLSDLRGGDWRVPEHVRAAIRGGSENERRRLPLSSEASECLARLTI
jgi:hypothetical protein